MELLTATRRRPSVIRSREVRVAEGLAAALAVFFALAVLVPPVLGLHQRVVDGPDRSVLGTMALSRTVPTGDLATGDRVVRAGELRLVTGRDVDAMVLDDGTRVATATSPTSVQVLVAAPYSKVLVALLVSAFAVVALLALARRHRQLHAVQLRRWRGLNAHGGMIRRSW